MAATGSSICGRDNAAPPLRRPANVRPNAFGAFAFEPGVAHARGGDERQPTALRTDKRSAREATADGPDSLSRPRSAASERRLHPLHHKPSAGWAGPAPGGAKAVTRREPPLADRPS